MGRINGRVTLLESGAGVPGLLVTVLADNRTGTGSRSVKTPLELGTSFTDSDGRFSVTLRKAGARDRAARYVVTASAPDGGDGKPGAILSQSQPRDRVVSDATVLLTVRTATLEKAGALGVLRTVAPWNHKPLLELSRLVSTSQERRQQEVLAFQRVAVDEERKEVLRVDAIAKRFVQAISDSNQARKDNFVGTDDSVKDKTKAILDKGANQWNKQSDDTGKVGYITVSKKMVDKFKLKDASGKWKKSIPASALAPLLTGSNSGAVRSILRTRQDGTSDACRKDAFGEILQDTEHSRVENRAGSRGRGSMNGQPAGSASDDDVPRYVGTVMAQGWLSGNGASDGNAKRADTKTIGDELDTLAFPRGPADVPSYHEFHDLRIAFDYVWQELLDSRLLWTATYLYRQVEEQGGDPRALRASDGNMLSALRAEARLVTRTSIKAKVAAMRIAAPSNTNDTDYLPNGDNPLPGYPDPPLPGGGGGGGWHGGGGGGGAGGGGTVGGGSQGKPACDCKAAEPSIDELVRDLETRLAEPYRFTVFGAACGERSVNFGLVFTYRQRWEPTTYQVGRLAKTIPLGPKETRKFSRKLVTRRSRAEKELQDHQRTTRDETSTQSRLEQEILAKAERKTNFNLTAKGGFDVLLSNGNTSTSTSVEETGLSQDVKKEFREAIRKASEEVRENTSVEINTSTGTETEETESGELSNPNDEITVTYLFYELQRRYRMSQQLYRATPVVLVAQEVPTPDKIDEGWIIANDWILRRVILDDTFVPAMSYLATRFRGDEATLQHLKDILEDNRSIVSALKNQVILREGEAKYRYAALEGYEEKRAKNLDAEQDGLFEDLFEGAFGGGEASPEAARLRQEFAKDAYQKAAEEARDMQVKLERAISALNVASDQYAKTLQEHVTHMVQIARLKLHIKQNIIYYMQAIWLHEPPDQRFLRLHNTQVPDLKGTLTYSLEEYDGSNAIYPDNVGTPLKVVAKCKLQTPLEYVPLAKVADLDRPLGFKGNYMILPLRESNMLTEYMLTPYVCAWRGLRDPDEIGNWTLEAFEDYVRCLKETMTEAEFQSVRPILARQYARILESPVRNGEEVVVPTDSLYIEALPGKHPVLEDFKLAHRAIDVMKAKSEVRGAELENVRLAARLLADERLVEDPTIERKVVVEGTAAGVIVGTEA